MKKFVVGAVVLGLFVAGCSKFGQPPKLTKEEVSKSLPPALCVKMIECMPKVEGAPTKEECEKAIEKQILEGKEGEKLPEITKVQLDTCLSGIAKMTCDQMMNSNEPPKECEFMK